jgi:hypothetical protein
MPDFTQNTPMSGTSTSRESKTGKDPKTLPRLLPCISLSWGVSPNLGLSCLVVSSLARLAPSGHARSRIQIVAHFLPLPRWPGRRSLNLSSHMLLQVRGDRLREPDRHRVPQLLIFLLSRSGQHESTKKTRPRFAGSLERAIGKSLLPAKQRKARVRPRVRDSRRIEVTSALQDAILCFTKREC